MNNKKQNGYALLITVVVISIILLIATGLSNTTTKQLILSSSAKDSQIAFYQADTAGECALYADYADKMFTMKDDGTGNLVRTSKTSFSCGNQDMSITLTSKANTDVYDFEPPTNTTGECFRIKITKKVEGPKTITTIQANGYNICDLTNIRTVERTIQVSY